MLVEVELKYLFVQIYDLVGSLIISDCTHLCADLPREISQTTQNINLNYSNRLEQCY